MTNTIPIDITNIPELRHLVEEMRESKQPRLLKQDRESVALLMPLGTTLKQEEPKTKEDVWTDYDAGNTGRGKHKKPPHRYSERTQPGKHTPPVLAYAVPD